MSAGPVRDRLVVRGLRVTGRHGVLASERSTGQDFVVDVALTLDTRAAAASDEVADTVDYADLVRRLAAVVAGPPVALVETLAERLAETCLIDPRVSEVEVTVHKPQAPIGLPVGDVSLTVHRGRE